MVTAQEIKFANNGNALPPLKTKEETMKKALVTGGSGFVGSNLVKRLKNDGWHVTVYGTKTEQPVEADKFYHLSLGMPQHEFFDVVFHQAANNDTMDQDKEEMMRVNYHQPISMFLGLAQAGCKNFVYASSTAVYGNEPAPYIEDITKISPLNPYAHSKAEFDRFTMSFAKDWHAKVIGLRYCNVFGPGEDHKGKRASMIHQLLQQKLQGKRPRLFKYGEQKRDFIYVDDVVEMNVAAANADIDSTIFNCGSGSAISFNEIIIAINEAYEQTHFDVEYFDNPNPETYQNHTECNMEKAEKLLGFVPNKDIKSQIMKFVHTKVPALPPWGSSIDHPEWNAFLPPELNEL